MFINTANIIVISRTDSIGDVILTLPLAVWLKKTYPEKKIIFLGRDYSQAIIEACSSVDQFVSLDYILGIKNPENQIDFFHQLKADAIIHVFPQKFVANLAKKAKIPVRIGTSHRIYHLWTCNKLVNLGRRNSSLHEAQLNLKLLFSAIGHPMVSLPILSSMKLLDKIKPVPEFLETMLDQNKVNLVLHPKSKGSAREWELENYNKLIKILDSKRYNIFITGTREEGTFCRDLTNENPEVYDLTGKLNLSELVSFINSVDALVAISTGPLHIASACGIHAIGIYAPIRPMHPARWGPIGPKSEFLVVERECNDCRKTRLCHCISEITPDMVKSRLDQIKR